MLTLCWHSVPLTMILPDQTVYFVPVPVRHYFGRRHELTKGKKELISAIALMSSTCVRVVVVHTNITPHTFAVFLLFMVPNISNGPNRSTAVEWNGGVGPTLWSGTGAMICSMASFARRMQTKQFCFTARAVVFPLTIHACALARTSIASIPP